MAAGVKSAPVFSLALLVLSYNGGRSLLGVAGGLALSACGDICLIWKDYFIHGMYLLYLLLWGVSGGAYVYLLPFLRRSPDADIFVPAVSAYTLLIVVMATLATRTRRLLVLLGGLSFIASDLTIVLQMFKVVESLDYGRHIVMTTYYLAQLLIAVGDVKATLAQEVDELGKWKRS